MSVFSLNEIGINKIADETGIEKEKLIETIFKLRNSSFGGELEELYLKKKKINKEYEGVLVELILSMFGYTGYYKESDVVNGHYEKIGKFMVKFSQLESIIRLHYVMALKCNPQFFENLMYSLDISIMITTLKRYFEQNYKQKNFYPLLEKGLKDCRKAVSVRNDICHGRWVVEKNGEMILLKINRGSLDSELVVRVRKDMDSLIFNINESIVSMSYLLHLTKRHDFQGEV